jgi:hypothetical protein
MKDVLGADRFRLTNRRGKVTGMLRISERTLDKDEELCACLIDWQKALDRVNGGKSVTMASTGAKEDCVDQSAEYEWAKGDEEWGGGGVRQGAARHCDLYSKYLNKESLDRLGDLKIGRKLIRMMKCADDLCYWLNRKRHCRT